MDMSATGRLQGDPAHDPLMPPGGDEIPTDAGAYIGHEPELARTIPGGIQRGDVRVSAVATQPTGAGADTQAAADQANGPRGHRQGPRTDDDTAREAGRDR